MRRVLLGLLVVLLGVLLTTTFHFTSQAAALSRALVDDANALEAQRFTLPHAQNGSVLDCLGRQADVAPDVSAVAPWTNVKVMAVASGADLSVLDDAQRDALAATRPWVLETLKCGALDTIVPADGIGPFADIKHGRRQAMPRAMESMTSLLPMVAASMSPHDALVACGDALTLSAAWLRLEGLESMLPLLGVFRSASGVCSRALPVADEAFHRRIAALLPVLPTFVDVMKVERTQAGLRLFGAWVPAEVNAQLPENAKRITQLQRDSKWSRGFTGTLALRLYWKRFDVGMRDVEAASAMAPAPRKTAILDAEARLRAPFLKRFFAADPVDLRYEMYAEYLDNVRATVESFAH